MLSSSTCRKGKAHMQKIYDFGLFTEKHSSEIIFSFKNSGHHVLIQTCPLKYIFEYRSVMMFSIMWNAFLKSGTYDITASQLANQSAVRVQTLSAASVCDFGSFLCRAVVMFWREEEVYPTSPEHLTAAGQCVRTRVRACPSSSQHLRLTPNERTCTERQSVAPRHSGSVGKRALWFSCCCHLPAARWAAGRRRSSGVSQEETRCSRSCNNLQNYIHKKQNKTHDWMDKGGRLRWTTHFYWITIIMKTYSVRGVNGGCVLQVETDEEFRGQHWTGVSVLGYSEYSDDRRRWLLFINVY